MDSKILLVGGVVAAGLVFVLYSKSKTQAANSTYLQSQALNNQSAAIAAQAAYRGSTAGQVSGVLSSVGGFLGSGALGNLFSSFGASTPGNNDPGLDSVSTEGDTSTNDPGLLDYSSIDLSGGVDVSGVGVYDAASGY